MMNFPRQQEDFVTLSDREREVLQCIASGLSSKQCALQLGIAPRTVERHVENLRNKLHARNKPHLVARPVRTLAAIGAARRLSGPGARLKFRHVAYWVEAAWLVRRMEQLRVEHLHAHFGTNPAAVAAIAHAWGGPPFSFTAHGPD